MKNLSQKRKEWIERTVENDRSYKAVVYNRFILCALLVLAQIILYFWLLFSTSQQSGWVVQLIFAIISVLVFLHLISHHKNPSTRLNWIILILIAPLVGGAMYILYGEGRPTKKMHEKMQAVKAEIYPMLKNSKNTATLTGTISDYLQTQAGYPAYTNGEISYYGEGADLYQEMLTALKSAKKFILLEYFIVSGGKMWKEMLQVLLEKAEQGVQIRMLYDDFGSILCLPPDYDKYMESLHPNIQCHAFNKVYPIFSIRLNNRDHRKILVVDGKTAFTGGLNLADEYIGQKIRFGHWKDSGVKLTGEAVNAFTAMFFAHWNTFRKTGEDATPYLIPSVEKPRNEGIIQPYDDSPLDNVSVGETVYQDMINRAQKYVYIFTPYLILDDFMRSALMDAALRGVDVRVVTPAIPDKKTVYRLTRANYQPLMEAGVKIYEYSPGFIHAKSMLCDDERAVVGSINLDYRSLYLHFENAVYFTDEAAIAALKKDCKNTFAVSKLCEPGYPKRTVFGRIFDSLLRLFETLM